jgi:hypothetical protein
MHLGLDAADRAVRFDEHGWDSMLADRLQATAAVLDLL